MSVLLCVTVTVLCSYVLIYYRLIRGHTCHSIGQVKGRTVLITGGHIGTGKYTALDLAKRGARVILTCDSKEKGEAAAFDIRRDSGNNQVLFMQLDLASLKSVRRFVETFLEIEPRLDILINNADQDVLSSHYEINRQKIELRHCVMGPGHTKDGFGLAFGVNHLGHFLLTTLLLEKLQQCGPSRVVAVAASTSSFSDIDLHFLASTKDLFPSQSAWHCYKSYCISKLCNVLFIRELANRLEGANVTCYSVHPGVIYTELSQSISPTLQLLLKPFAKVFFLDPEGGSQTTLHCTLQEGIELFSGRHFVNCSLQQAGAKGQDDALARKLWQLSERFTSLS